MFPFKDRKISNILLSSFSIDFVLHIIDTLFFNVGSEMVVAQSVFLPDETSGLLGDRIQGPIL
jgi:hypothetical protein